VWSIVTLQVECFHLIKYFQIYSTFYRTIIFTTKIWLFLCNELMAYVLVTYCKLNVSSSIVCQP
jgi:hypothetical protein